MIYDRVSRLPHYSNLSPLLARAIDYVKATDLNALTVGRHEVAGDDIYAAVHEYQTKPEDAVKFEAHKRYVDLQIIISGSERMDVADLDGLTPSKPYNESTDAAFYERPANVQRLVVSACEFAIFLPHDAHAPSLAVEKPAGVKKVVLKIRVW